MALYEVVLVFASLAIFGAIILPRLLSDKPLSFPLIYVVFGFVLFSLPTGVQVPNPIEHSGVTERLTEMVVIIALMGAGLKLDRPFDWRAWTPAWRLLGITMPLTIAAVAFLGWSFLGMLLPTAVLLGAVVAPTDPVLASDVQATEPTAQTDEEADPTQQEGEIRFSLTAEAGLNDGLAFPFTYLAITLAGVNATVQAGGEGDVVGALTDWLLVDFFYKIIAGVIVGYIIGKITAYLVFGEPSTTDLARVMEGAEAFAATLLSYGVGELAGGYGFISVFVTALVLRHYEWTHDYYQTLHDFAVMVERLLMAAVLVLFGGAIAGGLLDPLTWRVIAIGIVIVLVVRPLAGAIGLIGGRGTWGQRAVIASYGIRGIGSFYYLSYALNQASFQEVELIIAGPRLWALLGFIVIFSMVVHGLTVTVVMNRLDALRRAREADTEAHLSEPQTE